MQCMKWWDWVTCQGRCTQSQCPTTTLTLFFRKFLEVVSLAIHRLTFLCKSFPSGGWDFGKDACKCTYWFTFGKRKTTLWFACDHTYGKLYSKSHAITSDFATIYWHNCTMKYCVHRQLIKQGTYQTENHPIKTLTYRSLLQLASLKTTWKWIKCIENFDMHK